MDFTDKEKQISKVTITMVFFLLFTRTQNNIKLRFHILLHSENFFLHPINLLFDLPRHFYMFHYHLLHLFHVHLGMPPYSNKGMKRII